MKLLKSNKYLWFILLLFLATSLNAQTFIADSTKVEHLHNDTGKVEALMRIYDTYYTSYDSLFPKGLPFILDAYYLSVKLDYKKGIVKSAYRLGDNLLSVMNMAKSLEFYFIALRTSEELGDLKMQCKSLMGIGLVFYDQKRWKEAMDYFEKSIVICNQNKDNKSLATVIYLKGLCHNELKKFVDGEVFLQQALALAVSQSDSVLMYECTLGLANAESGLLLYDSALAKFNSCQQYYETKGEKVPLELIHFGKAQIFYSQHDLNKALLEAQIAYNFARNSPYTLKLDEITTLMYTIYNKTGNKDKAIQYLLENKQIRDSLNSIDIYDNIAVSSYNYKLEKKESEYKEEIERNNRRKNLALLFSSVFGVFLLFVIFAYQTVRKERRKSDELLLNILPKETTEELKRYGRAIPKSHPSVTIMFMDVMGFTTISSSMSAETLVNMIDLYFRNFDEIITRHGLEKIKTIGDAYMCAGGLHSNNAQLGHAENTINAAIEIMKFVKSEAQSIKSTYGYSFNFRIGIHTGDVVSGVVGSKKYAYDIWGDTVNMAARMEQTSQPDQINISSDTYKEVKGKYKIDYRGKISAKNKGELDMYYILWEA